MTVLIIVVLVMTIVLSDAKRLPNIVLIQADDLGVGMMETEQGFVSGAYIDSIGSICTPRIKKLATKGMYMNRFYSDSPVCSPARYAMMAGIPAGSEYSRIRGNGAIKPNRPGDLIRDHETTIALQLKSIGYNETAFFGKLGFSNHPFEMGYDKFLGAQKHMDAWYAFRDTIDESNGNSSVVTTHEYTPKNTALGIDTFKKESQCHLQGDKCEYIPSVIFNETIKWLREKVDRGEKFFLHFSPRLPHATFRNNMLVPRIDGPIADFTDTPGYTPVMKAVASAVTNYLDPQIGELYEALGDQKNNTLFIITADNGPTVYNGASAKKLFNGPMYNNGKFNGHKRSPMEGGVHIPFLVIYPGKIAPGSSSEHGAMLSDIGATINDIVGLDRHYTWGDATSFLPVLLETNGRAELDTEHEFMRMELSSTSNGNMKSNWGGWFSVIFGDKLQYKRLCNLGEIRPKLINRSMSRREINQACNKYVFDLRKGDLGVRRARVKRSIRAIYEESIVAIQSRV